VFLLVVGLLLNSNIKSQMRQIHLDLVNTNNEIKKLSFYSPSEGFIACTEFSADWVGYTIDSGRTYVKRYITLGNVNFNGYPVNITFGFGISGVKAFNQNNIVVYGDYGLVPSILYSTNGGVSYTLIYHSQFNPLQLLTGIEDMSFPENNAIGYAVDGDRILKTTNQGLSWTTSRTDPESLFDAIEAVDNNTVFVMSRDYTTNKLLKTTNGGSSWQMVTLPSLPGGKLTYAHFLTANTGWLGMFDNNNNYYFYKTITGGASWTLQNNIEATPFAATRMKFVDVNTGYAFGPQQNTVFKTFDSGVTWEPLPRDNSFAYLGYSHDALLAISPTQLWAGGNRAFLELTTNGGGTPLPKAFFRIDTVGYSNTGQVNLVNHSRTGYTYKWFVNNVQISTNYNTSYTHNVSNTYDTVKLVVTSGTFTDTAIKYQAFNPPVVVSIFSPISAGTGTVVNITGQNFTGATSVSFGGVPASSYTVVSPTSINATVGAGASGLVRVITPLGQGTKAGFIYIPPPAITSFNPTSATAGTIVIITGTGFTGATSVTFGGVPATTFNVVSATTITATAPSGPSGSVSVTTPGGTAILSGFISLPTITSFTPLQGTEGTVLTITGTSFSGTTGVTVGGVNVISFTVVSSISIRAIVGPGASGNVAVTKPGGSSSLPGFTWYPPPVIASFNPASGPVGTTVTITGTGFNPTASNNTVYFGSVKATVISGNATSLTVTVPEGATFQPISVISNYLIGYSSKPFLLTFPNGGSITANSFANRTTISTLSTEGPTRLELADMDNDGKSDIILTKYGNPGVSGAFIYRNTSAATTISFAIPIELPGGYESTTIADIDGDGKLDVVLQGLRLYRNISTTGNIAFAPAVTIAEANPPAALIVADFDGDGKVDIIGSRYWSESVSKIYRNISEPGAFSFASSISISLSTAERNMVATDLDGDNKPELVITGAGVYRNTSIKGNITFATPVAYPAYTHSYIANGDMDGDGKTDLISGDQNGSKISLIRNISTAGSISFEQQVEFNAMQGPAGIAVSDLDGDGKPDIAAALYNNSVGVFKNVSSPGIMSFLPKIDYSPITSGTESMVVIGDLNNDGKNDIVTCSEIQRAISIHKNEVKPEPTILSFTPTFGIAGTVVTITGNNFTGVTGVSFGGISAASFIVNSSTSITATVGTGASGNLSVTNNFGTGFRPGFSYGIPPVITSISTRFGTIGSSVIINGTGFNTAAGNNIVYFGGVKATVTSASATSLTVTVPTGALYESISITNAANGLTASSAEMFSLTYPGAGSAFTVNSFAARQDFTNGGMGTLSDIDSDGKLDLVFPYGSAGISVARNTSISPAISFAPNVTIATGAICSGICTGDLDGDGKQDVVTSNYDSQSISVIRNNSTSGAISFGTPVNILTGISTTRPSDVKIRDIDGDGRQDVLVANYYSNTLSVFKNISSPGTILLAPRVDYLVNGYPTGIASQDLDGDRMPEMIISLNGPQEASVFKNTSIPGSIAFALKTGYGVGSWPTNVSPGDIDGDGKIDLSVSNINSASLSVLRNTTSGSAITFAPKIDLTTGSGPNDVTAGDLDGDGKPELIAPNRYSGLTVSVFKNISTAGNIIVQTKVDYSVPVSPLSSTIGDIDGDGVPDMIIYGLGGQYSIFRNLTGSVATVQLCPNTGANLSANLSGSTYQWQLNTGTGFVNATNNANLSGVATATLQLINVPALWNNYEFKCIVNGTQSSQVYKLLIPASVTPSVSITANTSIACTGSIVSFTATQVNGGTAPAYQWKRNNSNVGPSAPTYSSTALVTGDVMNVIMTSNATCPSPASVTSNSITVTIITSSPVISISGNTTVLSGQSSAITSSVINAGTPGYQWQDSTAAHTWQNISGATNSSIVYIPTQTGNKIRCQVAGNPVCFTPGTTLSNVLSFVVTFPTAINPVPGSNFGIRYFPNPANTVLFIDSLKLSDKWQTLEVISIDGRSVFPITSMINKTTLSINVERLATGQYIAVLRRKNGVPAYLKFIKQ
jgi:hypothetical protein